MTGDCARCVSDRNLSGFASVRFCPACGRRRVWRYKRVAVVVLFTACSAIVIVPAARLLANRPPAESGIAGAGDGSNAQPGRLFIATADGASAPPASLEQHAPVAGGSPPPQAARPGQIRNDPGPLHRPPAGGVRVAVPWLRISEGMGTNGSFESQSPLVIVEPEMYQPTVGSECRGAFLLKNVSSGPINLSAGPGARFEISIWQDGRELCRCSGSWGPILGPGEEIRTSWTTHHDSLSVHPTGPFKPFVIAAPGEYRCRITLRLGGLQGPAAEIWESQFNVDR